MWKVEIKRKTIVKKRHSAKLNIIITILCLSWVFAACSGGRNSVEGTTAITDNSQTHTDMPRLVDDEEESGNGEESYSRALARANQTQQEGNAKLYETTDGNAEPRQKKNYTIMVYMTGSDLEEMHSAASTDLKEMIDSEIDYDRTNLIVYAGGARRWSCDISSAANQLLDMSLPEEERAVAATKKNSDMGSPDTLTEFLNYTAAHYPADHYALVFWDHGGGSVYGYGKDTLFKGDSLLLSEMKKAMNDSVFAKVGSCRLDWVGFDACLMATMENALVWKDYADYLVASEEVEAGDGWDYSFLKNLNEDKETLDICRGIVASFEKYYLANRTASFHPDITLSVMDLSRADQLASTLNDLAGEMSKDISGNSYARIVQAHIETKTFGLLGDERGSTFDLLDIGDLADQLAEYYPQKCKTLQDDVKALIPIKTDEVEGSCGVSMYFPGENRDLYKSLEGQEDSAMFVSKAFQEFTGTYASRWFQASETDWKMGKFEKKKNEILLKLTDEQVANLADASYSVLLNIGNGKYVRAMSRVSLKPDKNNLLHIPRDPKMIFAKGSRNHCSFYEAEKRGGRTIYKSQSTKIHYFPSPEGSKYVTASIEERSNHLVTQNISFDEGNLMESGKNTVNLKDYACVFENYNKLSPSYNDDGSIKPYYMWTFDEEGSSGTTLDYVNDGEISFEYRKSSEAEYPSILQIILKDINGDDHASDILKLSDGKKEKENVINKKTEKGKLEFLIDNGQAVLNKYEGEDKTLELPSKVDGIPVIGLKPTCIVTHNAEKLKELIIPEGIIYIDHMAVSHDNLLKISLPKSLQKVDILSFDRCTKLEDFKIADGNPYYSVKDGVLFSSDGKKLITYPSGKNKKYDVPEGTEIIGAGAFSGSPIEQVSFPDSLLRIDTIAFEGCEKIQTLKFNKHLQYIGNGAFDSLFKNRRDLKNLQLGPDLSFIGEKAFAGLQFHEFIVDKNNEYYSSKNGLLMTKAGDVALECPSIPGKRIVVPEGCSALRSKIFRYISPSTEFVLPSSLYRMSQYDFPEPYSDTGEEDQIKIVCSEGSAAQEFAFKYGFRFMTSDQADKQNDSGYDKTVQLLNGLCHFQVYDDYAVLISYEGDDTSFIIPETVDGKPVTEIGNGDVTVNISSDRHDLELESYYSDGSLFMRERMNRETGENKIILPDSIKRINKNALSISGMSDSDHSFKLPDQLEYLSPQAFGFIFGNGVSSFSISEDNEHYCCIDGVLFTKDKETLIMFPSVINSDSPMIDIEKNESGKEYYYYIPEGTKKIGRHAFDGLNELYEDYGSKKIHIVFPSSLETIENNAFQDASIYEIALNNGIKSIEENAFYMASLDKNELVLPDSLEEIQNNAFNNVRITDSSGDDLFGFSKIELPEDLRNLGEQAFSIYDPLKYKSYSVVDNLTIHRHLKEFNNRSFSKLPLRKITVDEENPQYASVEGLLLSKDKTKLLVVPDLWEGRLKLPDTLVSIDDYAFENCNAITEIIIPDSVSTISNTAFENIDSIPVFICSKDSYAAKYASNHQIEWKEK